MCEEVKLANGDSRNDVLAVGLVEVNRLLTDRLSDLVRLMMKCILVRIMIIAVLNCVVTFYR